MNKVLGWLLGVGIGSAWMSLASPSIAKTYVVNPEGTGDFPTIQEAIDATVDGDVVQLEDGVYLFFPNEALLFQGKEITLASQSGNPEACVLNGDGYNGRALAFLDGEGPSCIVDGLTIMGFGDPQYSTGPGVLILNDASPTIENCRILNCDSGSSGGAFAISGGEASFRDCLFAGNRAAGGGGGGSISNGANVSITRCRILGNRSTESSHSGALFVGSGSQVTLTECTVSGNSAAFEDHPLSNGGIYIAPGPVGSTVLHLVRSILWGNCGLEAYAWNGSAITFECSVVDSAEVLNLNGIVTYLDGNVFTNPQFCAPEPCTSAPTLAGDYTLAASSPALLAPCGPIGALGEGCSTVSIEDWSWGRIKGVYRVGAGGP